MMMHLQMDRQILFVNMKANSQILLSQYIRQRINTLNKCKYHGHINTHEQGENILRGVRGMIFGLIRKNFRSNMI